MYAERKMIPLKDVRIRLSHRRTDPAHSPGGEIAFEQMDAIDGSIELVGDLNVAQRQRLLEVAGRCWMHRTLSAGVAIRFHLQKASHPGLQGQTGVEIDRCEEPPHQDPECMHQGACSDAHSSFY